MKRFLLILLLIISFASPLCAADYYIAQTAAGDGDGTSCANADAIADLTWGAGNMVAAGDTLHLCGTITSTLTIGASGSAGHPITIKFEDDAKFSKPAWGTASAAAIYANAKNYITIDGGTNGIIENTGNGTALGTKQDTNALYVVSSSNWTIKNLTVKTMYARTPDSDDSNKYGKGIVIVASNSVVLHNLNVSDMYYGIYAYASGSNADGLTIQNTSISRVSTGIVASLNSAHNYTNVSIDNVKIFDLNVWDGCWNSCTVWNHNDGIHTWGNYGAGANKIQITIKNSTIGGDLGSHVTSWIYITDYTTDVEIYNNLLYTTAEQPSGGYIGLHSYGTGAANIYNNTIKGRATNNTGGAGIYFIGSAARWTADIRNNIITNCYIGVYDDANTPTIITSDYNDIYSVGNAGRVVGSWYTPLSSWQTALGGGCPSATGNECNSLTDDPKFVSSSDFSLQSDSPAINAGDDSVSTYLTTDILGNARADYDIGAYEYGGVDSFTVTIQSSGNCTVSPLTNQVIATGQAASYTCAANGNSGCAAWTGTCGGTGTTSFTSSAVTGNCTVIQGCYKISPDVAIGSGAAVTLGTGAVGTLY